MDFHTCLALLDTLDIDARDDDALLGVPGDMASAVVRGRSGPAAVGCIAAPPAAGGCSSQKTCGSELLRVVDGWVAD